MSSSLANVPNVSAVSNIPAIQKLNVPNLSTVPNVPTIPNIQKLNVPNVPTVPNINVPNTSTVPQQGKFSKFWNKTKNIAKKAKNLAKEGGEKTIVLANKIPAGKKFVMYCWIIIQIALILIILYIIYLIIFGAYPRVLVSLMFFSFFNQEPYDVFIKNNILWNSISILNSAGGKTGENICNEINTYATTDFNQHIISTEICDCANDLNNKINTNYGQYTSLKSFYAINEYFTFHDLIIQPDVHKSQDGLTIINNYSYYTYLQGYKQKFDGFIMSEFEKKGSFEVFVFNQYKSDQKYYNRMINVYPSFSNLGVQTSNINIQTEYLAYLIAPPTDLTVINADFPKNWNNITTMHSNVLYDNNYKPSMLKSSYSWLLSEISNNYSYEDLSDLISKHINSHEYNTLVAYVNAGSNMKSKIQNKLFGKKFEQIALSYKDVGIGSLKAMSSYAIGPKLYCGGAPKNDQTFILMTQIYPLFTFVYFNHEIPERASFYSNLIKLYTKCAGGNIDLSSTTSLNSVLTNLKTNITNVKDFINASQIVSLYLNVYQPNITADCSADFVDEKNFFKALFNPYMTDIINNRIKVYMKQTFNRDTWQNSYTQFLVKWEMVGQLIKDTISRIVRQFHTTSEIEKPKEESTNDMDNGT